MSLKCLAVRSVFALNFYFFTAKVDKQTRVYVQGRKVINQLYLMWVRQANEPL